MQQSWVEISCEIPELMTDLVADFLASLGTGGVTTGNYEVDTFSIDDITLPRTVTVSAYFEEEAAEETLAALAAFLKESGPNFEGFVFAEPVARPLADENWGTAWKQYFKPVRIGRRLVIKPTWESYEALEHDIILHIDPGMAFGTGTHPTTLLCLRAIEEAFEASPAPTTILDVGTGSGILAIAAAKLGATAVIGIDIDPEAVSVAADNVRLNEADTTVQVSTTPLDQTGCPYDIVVANILAEELVRLATLLVDRVRQGGFLILSGILIEKENLVVSGFSSFGLSSPTITREGEWSCICYRRP